MLGSDAKGGLNLISVSNRLNARQTWLSNLIS